jgi:hypothetical protein
MTDNDRIKLAVELYRNNEKLEYITAVTRLNGGAIKVAAKSAGLKSRREITAERNEKALKMLKDEVPVFMIAHELGVNPSVIYRMAAANGIEPQKMTLQQKRMAKIERQLKW